MVKKIYIYTIEEAKRLSPETKLLCSTKLPLAEIRCGKLVSDAAAGTEEQSSTVGSGY